MHGWVDDAPFAHPTRSRGQPAVPKIARQSEQCLEGSAQAPAFADKPRTRERPYLLQFGASVLPAAPTSALPAVPMPDLVAASTTSSLR